ncbi:MAG: lectin-like protein [Myxococcota bacterium]
MSPRHATARFLLVCLTLLGTGCFVGATYRCESAEDCTTGYSCQQGECLRTCTGGCETGAVCQDGTCVLLTGDGGSSGVVETSSSRAASSFAASSSSSSGEAGASSSGAAVSSSNAAASSSSSGGGSSSTSTSGGGASDAGVVDGAVTTCVDLDGDLHGPGCFAGPDCDENAPLAWRAYEAFVDADGDTYTVGEAVTLCAGNTLPTGYQPTRSATDDCKDTDGTAWRLRTGFLDADGDSYTQATATELCTEDVTTVGYQSELIGPDCDDDDDQVWAAQTGYVDADGDTYTVGEAVTLCTNGVLPTGYQASASAPLDCDDGDPSAWSAVMLYVDGDGDSYTVGGGTPDCVGQPPAGYTTIPSAEEDCDDGNSALWQYLTGYLDGDGDNWTTAGEQVCSGAALPGAYRAQGTNPVDCDDTRNNVRPGGTETCNSRDDDCDGLRDESGCGCDMFTRNGHAYGFCAFDDNWFGARDSCSAYGYHLVTISDSQENAWLSSTAESLAGGQWWIGYNDRGNEGQFSWVSGSSSYVNWNAATNEPNNNLDEDCATINNFLPNATWNDAECTMGRPFICEAE